MTTEKQIEDNHTPGRLSVDKSDCKDFTILVADAGCVAVMEANPFVGIRSEANARRLAACWNACEGLSTETIESGAKMIRQTMRDMDILQRQVIQDRWQRDALLHAMPTVSHPGGKLVKVVGHYEDGTTQTIDGEIVTAAVRQCECDK